MHGSFWYVQTVAAAFKTEWCGQVSGALNLSSCGAEADCCGQLLPESALLMIATGNHKADDAG